MTKQRKQDHLETCLQEKVETGSSGFDSYHFTHQALPEINFDEINLSCQFLKKKLNYPILISSMTGGTTKAKTINLNLAQTAQKLRIAMAVGSQRIAIEKPPIASTFQIRKVAPNIVLLSNLGAVQLNYGFGIKECRQAIKMIGADGLVFHLNPLQEVIQPGGNKNFSNLLKKIKKITAQIKIPVIVKEVGCGISQKTARSLLNAGIKTIDVSGQGGTSWALIESSRRKKNKQLGKVFSQWGIPTAEAITECNKIKELTIIGSGGIRTGIDMAKALILGADIVGIALPLLKPATKSARAVEEKIKSLIQELKITMFCLGVKNIKELKSLELSAFRQTPTRQLRPHHPLLQK